MGFQVDQTINIFLTLKEKWENPTIRKFSKERKKEKVQTPPSRGIVLGFG